MITRKQYMDSTLAEQPAAHRAYYGEIAKEARITIPNDIVERSRKALANGDTHLNTIPLGTWDAMAMAREHQLRPILKARGDSFSLGNGVCAVKEAAKLYVEGILPQ